MAGQANLAGLTSAISGADAAPRPKWGERNIDIRHDSEDNLTSGVVVFLNEDHTLGNLLRFLLIRQDGVEAAMYSVPHPSEPYLHVRVQCKTKTVSEAIAKAFEDMEELAHTMGQKFIDSCDAAAIPIDDRSRRAVGLEALAASRAGSSAKK
eukprot:Amastigsp_a842696_1114.p1 type:complete len:152 gc:universal Amastigsp_a842696_1114:41-496(+)